MSENDEAKAPIRRYKRRGNQVGLGIAIGAGLGVATGQMATWIPIGFGLGILVGGILQRRARRTR